MLHTSQELDQPKVNPTTPNTETLGTQPFGLHAIIDINRFPSLTKLLRVTALVRGFITCLQTKRKFTGITSTDLEEAETLWINTVQKSTFPEEIENLQQNNRQGCLIKQLKLFLDEKGMLRCYGRLHNATIAYDAKFPILLPKYHQFTDLVIEDAHSKVLHAGVGTTLVHIRQRFWIINGRQRVKAILHKCVKCRKVTGTSYRQPVTPPLPKCRVTESQPFAITGVDFSGAMNIKSESGSNKAYICLFTCAVTRAVHLEVVPNLSTATFLHAFRRFVARRSLPQKMISDNASTYTLAAEELRQLFRKQKVNEYLTYLCTEWQFIPKRAPWFCGFWERLIGMTKTLIKKVLGKAQITFTELATIVTEIEAVINNGRLTYVSHSINDAEPLTLHT